MRQPTIRERLAVIEAMFTNHLKHHERATRYLLAPILAGVIIGIVLNLVK